MYPHTPTDTHTTGRPAPAWTPEAIRALGPVTDIATAGQILGLSRSSAYVLAADGVVPVPVIRVGSRYRVPVAALLAALHIPLSADPPTASTPTAGPPPQPSAT